MSDPSSGLGRELNAAEDFFELAKSASSPFMRAYYRRVAEVKRPIICQLRHVIPFRTHAKVV
jgi:hypothetical protein